MGTKNNPAEFDCYKNAEPDEPMFILLARDRSAPDIVREWAKKRRNLIILGEKPSEDLKMVEEAYQCAEKMEQWRATNRS
jgi:hypothetical protein